MFDGDSSRTKKEVIAWAVIELCCSKRYATEIVQAFVDCKKVKEHEGFLVRNGI